MPELDNGITFFNELSLNVDAGVVFGGVSNSFDYRDIQDYSLKKKNIGCVVNSEYVIRCAKGYEKIVESKVLNQCKAIRSDCLPERFTEFFFLKYKRRI